MRGAELWRRVVGGGACAAAPLLQTARKEGSAACDQAPERAIDDPMFGPTLRLGSCCPLAVEVAMIARSFWIAVAMNAVAVGSAAAASPTNDAAAFKTFHLYTDRVASGNVIDHTNVMAYPGSLISPALLVLRSPGSSDTVALFRSMPNDGIFLEVNEGASQSYSTYVVSPPQYITSIGTLAMGVNIYNSTAPFADFNKPLMRVVATYVDGDTAVVTLHVGNHLRALFDSGSLNCGFPRPLYTLAPTHSLSGVIYQSGGYAYDVQELELPASKRSKRVASIRVEGVLLDHVCSIQVPHIYASSRLSGLSAWPEFEVKNAQNQPVVRQSQNTGEAHGGYRFGGVVVGTRRLTDDTACQVASLAMCYTFAGFECTVDQLNAYLQDHRGYQPSDVARVSWSSPTGDAIRYTVYTRDDTRLRTDDLFLVERGDYTNPLATYRVTSPGHAVRLVNHDPSTPAVEGDKCRVYWNMLTRVADAFTQGPTLLTTDLVASTQLSDQVEGLLAQGIPVQVNLETVGHMVVADGRAASFRPGGAARGTYSIKDPYNARNFTRLIESGVINGRPYDYANKFRLARYVTPQGAVLPLAPDSPTVAGSGVASLSLLVDGARRVELVDPLGRVMSRDASTGEDVSEIPGAWIMDIGSEHDNGADWDDSQTGYSIDVEVALDGHYLVRLYAENGLALNASSYDETGVISSDAVGDTTVGATANLYDVVYAVSTRTVTVAYLGTLGVSPPPLPANPSRLAVLSNPSSGPVRFVVTGLTGGEDAIEVFDTSGRRVDVLRVVQGAQGVTWNWRHRVGSAGVYLARLKSESGVVRFVVIR